MEKPEAHLSHHQTWGRRATDPAQHQGRGVPWHQPETQPYHREQLRSSLQCRGIKLNVKVKCCHSAQASHEQIHLGIHWSPVHWS